LKKPYKNYKKIDMEVYKKIITLFFCCTQIITAQSAFHNFGNIQIHNSGQIGFHTDLINDGTFNSNLGLAGFYSSVQLNVSGTSIAEFFDVEIDVANGLNLETSLGIYNQLDFITGKIFTPRNTIDVSLEFLQATYTGESDNEHIDGYSTIFGNTDFTFPIGHANKLRPLSISQPNTNTIFKSAYFFENPNMPSTFITGFDTNSFSPILSKVNDKEFWDLNGDQEVEVTLTWDSNSDISNLTNDINFLHVVGWNGTTARWESLGKNEISGDLENGFITSSPFIPDDYVVLTIASEPSENEITINTGFSPNGDGSNDVFEITELDLTQENSIEIYDRWGGLLYKKKNYDNSWGGISENSRTVEKGHLVPVGTYFFILKIIDKNTQEEKIYKGWVYINY